jgi:hypothetical protein
MPDEPFERSIRDYIADGAAEGAMAAAQRISEAAGVGLNDVLAAVQRAELRKVADAVLADAAKVIGDLPNVKVAVEVHAGKMVVKYPADAGVATDVLSVVRQVDVDELSLEATRGKLPAALQSGNRRILMAVVLLAAIYPVLPPEVQTALRNEGPLMAAIAAILALFKA